MATVTTASEPGELTSSMRKRQRALITIAVCGKATVGNTTPTSCSKLAPAPFDASCTSSRTDESRYIAPLETCSSALSEIAATLNMLLKIGAAGIGGEAGGCEGGHGGDGGNGGEIGGGDKAQVTAADTRYTQVSSVFSCQPSRLGGGGDSGGGEQGGENGGGRPGGEVGGEGGREGGGGSNGGAGGASGGDGGR
eukprot:6716338-Prymnesium_polylepis.2